MTPFPMSRLGHNNQALTKKTLIKVREATLGFTKPKSQTTLKVCEQGHDFPRWPHYQPTLRDALKACACPRKLTLLASSLGAKFPQPQGGVRFWFEPTRNSSICPMPFDNSIALYKFFMIQSLGSFKAFISLAFDVVHFVWHSVPLKETWCPHHTLRLFFFAGLVWNSSMVSWACSMLDSFTQEASIGWYPFHFTRYSRSRPLNYLDLSTASTSNSGSLWTKSGGGLEVCSRLGLEASRAIGFKKETWNVGWTLRFSSSSNL